MEHLDDEENITIIKDSLNNEELKVADKVADEILQKEEQERRSHQETASPFFFLSFILS